MSELLALVRQGDSRELLARLLELGYTGVVCEPGALPGPATTAQGLGLDLVAVLDPEGDGSQVAEAASGAGAWMVWSRSGETPFRRLGDASEVEAMLGEGSPPEGVVWATPEGGDPGAGADDALEELIAQLKEIGFSGGIALRGEGDARFQRLRQLAGDALAEGESWWDGSEDGY